MTERMRGREEVLTGTTKRKRTYEEEQHNIQSTRNENNKRRRRFDEEEEEQVRSSLTPQHNSPDRNVNDQQQRQYIQSIANQINQGYYDNEQHNTQQQQQQQQQQNVTDPACRVYVGNINYDLSQDDVKRSFVPFGAIKNIMWNRDPVTHKHKGYCFIDFYTPESAVNAINAMNGFLLGGRPLKLGRPKTDTANSPSPVQTNTSTCSGSSDNLSQNKIYVGNIHWDVTENDLVNVFSAIGTIVSCQLTANTETGKHKGYGFIQYTTAKQAEDAINILDGFELVDRKLKVGKAIPGIGNKQSQHTSEHSDSIEEDALVKGATQRYMVMQRFMRETNIGSSRCILLTNMVDPNNERDSHLESQISNECSKYGTVDKVIVYSERSSGRINNNDNTRVFVLFRELNDALTARFALDKRYISGRVVNAQFYPAEQFLNGEYSI
jgi:poly(U)-binding-splicing factor PUF60